MSHSPQSITPQTNALIIHASRWKYGWFLLLALGFVALGIALLYLNKATWAAWLTIVFFGGGALIFLRQLTDRRPRLIIDPQGVFDRTLGIGWIVWSDILDLQLFSIQGQPFIGLKLINESDYLARLSPLKRKLIAGNQKFGFPTLSLNLSGLLVKPEQIYEFVARMAAAHQGNRS